MFSRSGLFILVAIYFIFTYPRLVNGFSLNDSIGWGSGRALQTYFIPIWFLLIFFTYKNLSAKKIVIPSYFFWLHVLITIIPTWFINYPFTKKYYNLDTSIEKLMESVGAINKMIVAYFIVQVLFYSFLVFKLIKGRSENNEKVL